MDHTKRASKLIWRLLTAALVLFWMLAIGSFSAQKGQESSGLSRKAAGILVSAEDTFFQRNFSDAQREQRIEALQFPIRKGAHMTEYGILAVLLALHLGTYQLKNGLFLFLSWLSAVAYAAADEIHQLFVPGRSGQFTDVCIDGAGALIGVLLFFSVYRIWLRHKALARVTG